MAEARGYRPIADYAAIGDCHGCALIAKDGGIDWCCFDRFDAEPMFLRILDAGRGGYLAITPSNVVAASRAYLPGTNIVRTEFRTPTGVLAVTDFMPLGRSAKAGPNDYVDVEAPGWLVRRMEVLQGEVDLDIVCRPAREFALAKVAFRPDDCGYEIVGTKRAVRSDLRLDVLGDCVQANAALRAGDRRFIVLAPVDHRVDSATVDALFAVTQAYWREWIGYCRHEGPYRAFVERSALALKMMTFPPEGTCVAAPTTSLPEAIGGVRNWDYRFCWIRDASLMLHALSSLGYSGESDRFFDFLCRMMESGVRNLQIMYGLAGERELEERTLDQLEGYAGSRPVRIGNAAHDQRQSDLYGYILEGALIYRKLGRAIGKGDKLVLAQIADFIGECWALPDNGIWEMRAAPRHFVHSKAMCWVVVDRAIRLLGERREWVDLRERIWQEILRRGRDPTGGHLLQTYDEGGPRAVDAALLQLAVLGLPMDVAMIRSTRLAVERELRTGDFLSRYKGADGVPGSDGAFLVCSFWLVDSLLAEGEGEEATRLFERLLACANDVGLYSEEIDPPSKAFLGNFPQAFTHLGLINTAVSLTLFRKYGAEGVRGGYADRAHRSVRATFGWRGVLAALLSTGRIRLRSSSASKLRIDLKRQ